MAWTNAKQMSDKPRKAQDLYETPYSMTRDLLERESFPGPVLEPAKGGGAIVRVLENWGQEVVAYDLETNFLLEAGEYPSIITNPPYTYANEFIYKCKKVATKKFALLLPLQYLNGKKRYATVFTDTEFPLGRVYVYTTQAMLGEPLREDGTYGRGMMIYAWYVWV